MARLWFEGWRRCNSPALLSLLYIVASLLWLGADHLFFLIGLSNVLSSLPSLFKNSIGVMVSGGLLYGLLLAHARKARRARQMHEYVEDRLRGARDEMESRVQERTAELQTINQTLKRQIAARVQVEIALRDSEERFRQLAEHIREVFWVYGIVEERMIYISPAYEEIWGRSVANFHERPFDWLEAVHPDDRSRIQVAHVAKSQSGHLEEEYRIVRPDGAVRWIWDRGFPVRDETGHVYRIAGLAEDITARKLADDQLRRQQAELARTSRLSLAVELASNLAHELNQPLAAIVAYTQACLTLLRQGKTDPREITTTFEEVVNQSLRAGEIIRHLRELVRRHTTVQTVIDLNTVIHAVISYAQLELRQAKLDLKLELAEPLPRVLADDLQIQLVVLYLLRNAIEAMQETDGGPHQLAIQTALLNANVVLVTIRDTGHGFSGEIADRLFQPFFTTKPGGMGLGLSVSRSIIEAQGGQLWATPNPDRGVSFHFTLPTPVTVYPSYSSHELDSDRFSH
ncbi:MAG: PAS domain-containing protein [Gammaproteobacteria bacterium]|nr:PAS domain-containing protein [Gammaproteobacteria bacterium]MCP5196726.1 PAS domain-containing protein [Gammaproteobacteria bacterium]